MQEPDLLLSRVAIVAHYMQQDLNLALAPLGLNASNYYFILKLGRVEQLSQDAIFKTIHLSQSNVTRRLTQLSGLGLITREKDPNDKRAWKVKLTSSGQSLLPKVEKVVQEVQANWSADLSANEVDGLARALDILVTRYEAEV